MSGKRGGLPSQPFQLQGRQPTRRERSMTTALPSSSFSDCSNTGSPIEKQYRSKNMSTSPRKFSERSEVFTYRQHFALVWRDFIKANFESPAHVAHVLKVDPTTAEKWWAGRFTPRCHMSAMALWLVRVSVYTSISQVPLFRYGLIMADPPWAYEN